MAQSERRIPDQSAWRKRAWATRYAMYGEKGHNAPTKDRQCTMDGCCKPHHARGYCLNHYSLWKNKGYPDLEPGFTRRGAPLEFLQNTVLQFRDDDCLEWPFVRDRNGYGYLRYNGRDRTVSRVVCEIVNGPPPADGYDAAHSCGKGHLGCVNPRHIVWKTHIANMHDQEIHGTKASGERNGHAKLSWADVVEIRRIGRSMTQRAIGARYGVDNSTIGFILSGRNWKDEPRG